MSQEGILSENTSPAADIEFLEGDSGGLVGASGAHAITITGNPDIDIVGTPGLHNLQLTNLTKTTPFVVDAVAGAAPYSTVQSAITAAVTAGGPQIVFVREGSYTENIIFADDVTVIGSGRNTDIIGVHTPPTTGICYVRSCHFISAADIFETLTAGTAEINLFECFFSITNGFIFDLGNWSGLMRLVLCRDINSPRNKVCAVIGSSTATLLIFDCHIGTGNSPGQMSGDQMFLLNSRIGCKMVALNNTKVWASMGCFFDNTVSIQGNSTGEFYNCQFATTHNVAIDTVSTGEVTISEVTFDSSASNVITGTGTVNLGSATFVDSDGIEGTLTISEEDFLHTAELVSNNMERLKFSGFYEWTGAGSYWTVAGTDFTIDRPGAGYIKGRRIAWTGGQTVSSLSQGNTHYIYIDDTGTIGSTTTFSQSLYEDNIVLFEVLVDNDTPANVLVVKENHPYSSPTDLSIYLHNTIGTVISNKNNGANIVAGVAADEIGISGTDFLEDHGLETTIPDSGGASEAWNFFYTDGGGKWVLDSTTATFPSSYNNAGTVTALTANRYGVFRLYASKDNIETTTPEYIAVINDAQYLNLNLAQTAVANGTVSAATAELMDLELAQLGFVIYEESSSTIVDIIIEKSVVRGNTVLSGTNEANLVLTDTTNFDGFLSAADTTVQQSLETLDELEKGAIFSGGVKATSFTTTNATAALEVLDDTISGTGTDANVDIALTPKGTGVVDASSNDVHTTGVSFDTGTNTLDFYEEGTFTPVLEFGGGSTGITYITQVGTYTRIGNRVLFDIRIILTSKGTDTGGAVVDGLPYTSDNLVQYSLARWKNIDLTASYTIISGRLSSGQSDINLQQVGDNVSPINVLDSDFSDNSDLYIEGTYRVA